MHFKTSLTLAAFTLTLTACAWVKPTPEGERVQVLTAAEVTDCIDMGRTTASLKDRVAGIERSKNKVKWELITLARNSAANMDGDTIAPLSEVNNGSQIFGVYKCVGTRSKDYRFPPLSEPGK